MFERTAGVLLHISCLPGDFGIGSFGKEARQFADNLHTAGLSAWQVLPFGHTGSFHSPYQCYSAFAGNPYLIDIPTLYEQGLITKQEFEAAKSSEPPFACDFLFLEKTRIPLLQKAFSRITPEIQKKIDLFCYENSHWLPDYALFITLCKEFGTDDWRNWDAPLAKREATAIETAIEAYQESIDFWCFVQYEFFRQWQETKAYINRLGIAVIGDIPIYLSMHSADVWSHPELFELDADGEPTLVAGVPPDYFSEEGQLWGNPLYNWNAMKQDGYQWWMERMKASFHMYDVVRIDHFRGFAEYWAVPASETSAKKGSWKPGPGMDFFRVLSRHFPDPPIIAEDLGEIDQTVRDLLDETGFPGMKVMQFGFLSKDDSYHLPHNYTKNSIAYTGTHDNNTTLGWLWEAEPWQRKLALDYCNFIGTDWGIGGYQSPAVRAFLRALWQSHSAVAIIAAQDLCGYGGDTKMNTPGKAEGNWSFRFMSNALDGIDYAYLKELTALYRRNRPFWG